MSLKKRLIPCMKQNKDGLIININSQAGINHKAERTVYNAFINSRVEPINSKNRQFNTLDMFPTTLASLGVTIEGNKLGLGTNLFSSEKTLTEKFGHEYINIETSKKSLYYNNNFLRQDYYDMIS